MQLHKQVLIHLILFSRCATENHLDGLWSLKETENEDIVYMELEIAGSDYKLFRDGKHIQQLDVYKERDTLYDFSRQFKIYCSNSDLLYVQNIADGKRETYKKVTGSHSSDDYIKLMYRRFNFYTHKIDAGDTMKINRMKDEMWEYFNVDVYRMPEIDETIEIRSSD